MDTPSPDPKAPPKRRPIRWGWVLRVAAVAVPVTILVLFAGGARIYAYFFTHSGCVGPLESLEAQGYPSEAVSFLSRQGHTLRGWFSPGKEHPEIAIVVLPGAAGNSYFALADAAILAEAGYSTLVYEHRSCADPALLHSGGYWESFDLMGAVDYLKTRPDVQHVGVMGFSTGGSTTIIAAGQHTGIEATLAQGGFASLASDTLDPSEIHNPLDWYTRQWIMFFYQYGEGIPVDKDAPVAYIGEISPRPILLIYGDREADAGQMLYEAAGEPKELWIVPNAGHGDYPRVAPDEFRRRVVAFFDSVFGVER